MKHQRFQYKYRENASKLHKKIGEALRSGIFSNYKIYQEYPVSKILPSANNSYHFDWVILDLQLVIEGMGIQHYICSSFSSGQSNEEIIDTFYNQKYRDNEKMEAAIAAGFTYIEIPYNDIDKISPAYILNKYWEARNNGEGMSP